VTCITVIELTLEFGLLDICECTQQFAIPKMEGLSSLAEPKYLGYRTEERTGSGIFLLECQVRGDRHACDYSTS
jgi:hypothetical protein